MVSAAKLRQYLAQQIGATQSAMDNQPAGSLGLARFLGERTGYENTLDALDAGLFEAQKRKRAAAHQSTEGTEK